MKSSLLKLWRSSLDEINPELDPSALERFAPSAKNAALFWGKAGPATASAVERLLGAKPRTQLVLSEQSGEHPIPGEKSFQAAAALLDFFSELKRSEVQALDVFLSGGASSLAWLKSAWMPKSELQSRLVALYRRGLNIQELNERRSILCGLKMGGAARWLQRLAPGVKTRVAVISDVMPFSPKWVGSGPFWDGKIKHLVLESNQSWVERLEKLAHGSFSKRAGITLGVEDWAESMAQGVAQALEKNHSGLMIWGGEPLIRLKAPARGANRRGLGGRLSHLALLLAIKLRSQLLEGRVEIFCGTSDGKDGSSGSSATWIDRQAARLLFHAPSARLAKGVLNFDSASVLAPSGALIPSFSSFTNVQDVAIIKVASPLLR